MMHIKKILYIFLIKKKQIRIIKKIKRLMISILKKTMSQLNLLKNLMVNIKLTMFLINSLKKYHHKV